MIEVEVKVVLDAKEKQEVLRKLRGTCPTEKFYEEEDIFFTSMHDPSLGFEKTLKLRKSNGEAKLIFKLRRSDKDLKENLEIEVKIEGRDINNLLQLLKSLGFEENLIVRKKRRSFCLNGCTINVDDVEGLGSFLEIEVVVDEDKTDDAFNRILEILSALNLSKKELIRRGYAEMIARHDM